MEKLGRGRSDVTKWCYPPGPAIPRVLATLIDAPVLRRAAGNNLPMGRPCQADRDGLGRPSYIELGKLFPAARLSILLAFRFIAQTQAGSLRHRIGHPKA